MKALDSLSVTANVLQVIGFHADTVFCLGQGLYELIDKARLASQTITLLLHQLQALLSVVALVKIVIDKHQHSPFAHEDGHGLPNIQTLLLLIEQDFRHLKSILDTTAGSSQAGWFSTFHTSFWWALKDRDVVDARQRLSQYTQQLSAALSAVGRRNDIVFRNKLQSIEDKLHAISQSKTTNGSSQGTVAQRTHQKPVVRVPKRSKKPPVSLQKKESQKRPSMSYHSTDTAPSCQMTEDSNCPELSMYEQADKTLIIETSNYELGQFAKALFLLRDSFVSCLGGGSYSINRVVSISKPQADHLGMLFDFLVASAHESSAQAIMNKYQDAANVAPSRVQLATNFEKRQDGNVNDRKDTQKALYLVEENVTMETNIGAVHARILSARSSKGMMTLGFEFHYTGHQSLALSPFAINYMSHAAMDYNTKHSLYQSLAVPPYDFRSSCHPARNFTTANRHGRDKTRDKRLLWIPKQFCSTPEAFNGFLSVLSNDLDVPEIASMRLWGKVRDARFGRKSRIFYSPAAECGT
ncbi:hypothetical protein DE146DRAFT_52241 [Phaeosphaeria sp. MPI-PUGE-AT-0046c]|nr:hypothetical protein DE146DRAFT_52241 [Phaeosphaeria sp. MPI-PUGE-AT-0046c]